MIISRDPAATRYTWKSLNGLFTHVAKFTQLACKTALTPVLIFICKNVS